MKSTHTRPIHQYKYQLQQLAPIAEKIWEEIECKERYLLKMYENPECTESAQRIINYTEQILQRERETYISEFNFTRHQSAPDDLPF